MKTKYGEFENEIKYIEHLESLVSQEQERADINYDKLEKAWDENNKLLEKIAQIRLIMEE